MQLSAESLRGGKVTNYDNELLGTIEDFMPDGLSGDAGYAVMSLTGLNANEKLCPVPLRALTVASDRRQFMLNADREMLNHAPAFDRQSWPDIPDFADPHWRSGIHSYYSF